MDKPNPSGSAAKESPAEKKRGREDFLASLRGGVEASSGAVRDLALAFLEGGPVEPPRKKTREELFEAIFAREFGLGLEVDAVDIEVPLIHIFGTVMQRMHSTPPQYRYSTNEMNQVKFIVDFEVPAKYAAEKTPMKHRIEGDAVAGMDFAQDNAIRKCFECLAREHRIIVVDFSSRKAKEILKKTQDYTPRVRDAAECIHEVFGNWGRILHDVSRFMAVLRRKLRNEETTYGVVSETGAVYSEAVSFLGGITEDGYKDMNAMVVEREELDSLRRAFTEYAMSFFQGSNRARKHEVYFTEKDVLEYVMGIMKRPPPEYMSRPYTEHSMFHGYAIVDLPYVENITCSGRILLEDPAVKATSIRAEEHAAGNAICYIESKYCLNVKDLNYTDRVEAKARHDEMDGLEWKFFHLGDKIKHRWSNMNKCLEVARDLYGYVPEFTPPAKKKALDFCAPDVKKLYADSVEAQKAAVEKMKLLKK